MLSKTKIKVALMAAFCIAGVVLSWASTHSSSYEACKQERYASNHSAPDFEKKIAYFIVCEGVAIDANGELITALGTIAVALFTLTLWRTSDKQAFLTRESIDEVKRSSQIQLRSYLFVDEARLDDVRVGLTPIATVSIKNFGQTPADTVSCAVVLGLQPNPLPENDLPELSSDAQRPLGPNQSFRMRPKLKDRLSKEELAQLEKGELCIYLLGHVDYRDRFGDPCSLDFCLFSGTEHAPLGSFAAYKTGNGYS